MATESLQVRIEADTTGFEQGLGRASDLLSQFEQQASQTTRSVERLGQQLGQLGGAVSGLSNVSRALGQVQNQLGQLSRTPVSLNIGPALQALGQLSQAIANTAARLAQLSAGVGAAALPFAATGFAGGGGGGGGGGPIRGFANGGLVQGPLGHDRVPAWLTAGEFVLRRDSVQQLGLTFLEALNQQPQQVRRTPSFSAAEGPPSGRASWGDVHIEIRDATQIGPVLQELSRAEANLRVRRG